MSKQVVHLPPGILPTLHETASHTEGLDIETLISAAIWSFAQQNPAIRTAIISGFWYGEISEWQAKQKNSSLLGRIYELGKHLYAQICESVAK